MNLKKVHLIIIQWEGMACYPVVVHRY